MTLPEDVAVLLLGFLSIPAAAQPRVSPRNTYERLLVIVPMQGSGTPADPRRPMYAPLPPAPGEPLSRSGILAFTFQESDDGRVALVEFVAVDRAAFAEILADKDRRPDVRVFEKGKARRADIEAEFRKFARNVDLDRFGVNCSVLPRLRDSRV